MYPDLSSIVQASKETHPVQGASAMTTQSAPIPTSIEIQHEVDRIVAKEVARARCAQGLPVSNTLFDEQEQAECVCDNPDEEEDEWMSPQSVRQSVQHFPSNPSRRHPSPPSVPGIDLIEQQLVQMMVGQGLRLG